MSVKFWTKKRILKNKTNKQTNKQRKNIYVWNPGPKREYEKTKKQI